MVAYEIFFKESVEKDLAVIPDKNLKRIVRVIGRLAENHHHPECENLTGKERYRLRHGSCRIVYSIDGSELIVWGVKMRHCSSIKLWQENKEN
jgi:mRNA interferase RelE/StbE